MLSSGLDQFPDPDDAISALSGPIYTLLADPNQSSESLEAFDLFCQGLTSFNVALTHDSQLGADFGGRLFVGIDGIRQLHEILIAFEDAVDINKEPDSMAKRALQEKSNPEIARKTRQGLWRRKKQVE